MSVTALATVRCGVSVGIEVAGAVGGIDVVGDGGAVSVVTVGVKVAGDVVGLDVVGDCGVVSGVHRACRSG